MTQDGPVRRAVFVNQVGYPADGPKWFVVEGLEPEAPGTFVVGNVDAQEPKWIVFEGKLRQVSGDFGPYHVGQFSPLTAPGTYVILAPTPGASPFCSHTFQIGKGVYDDAIRRGLHSFAVQRCGPSATGYHAPCHLDDAVRADNGRFLDLVGGWHNSNDLAKWSGPSLASLHGLLNVAALNGDESLKRALFEEIRWGNLYFHKLQDPEGYVYHYGVGGDPTAEANHWTDNIRGTPDDRRAVCNVAGIGDQHAFVWAQALTAALYGGPDPDYAKRCLTAAQRCLAWVRGSEGAKKFSPRYYTLGAGIGAGLWLLRATGNPEYGLYAEEMADRFIALQEQDYIGNQREARGFFYENADRRWGVVLEICNPLALIALCELIESLPGHAKAPAWRRALELHCRDYLQVMANRNAFAQLPRAMRRDDFTTPFRFGSGGIPVNRKLGELGYRYFDFAARNCVLGGHAVALFKAARLFDRPDWAVIAQRQLDWVFGANPFGVSFMVDVGHVNPPEYIYTGFQPRTPWIPGMLMQGIVGDRFDRPDLMPGAHISGEFWIVHTSFVLWALAEAEAFYNRRPIARSDA